MENIVIETKSGVKHDWVYSVEETNFGPKNKLHTFSLSIDSKRACQKPFLINGEAEDLDKVRSGCEEQIASSFYTDGELNY